MVGSVPCEENGGRVWLPLGCIVTLEWLVDAKHGVMAWVCYSRELTRGGFVSVAVGVSDR